LPKFLSSDAKDFLGRIFETDPEKRIDIDGIRAHPWYKLHQPENTHFNHHNQKVRVSSKVVQKLEA
jgi:serine/threonine protein kinase